MNILDDFLETGTTLEGLKSVLESMAADTKVLRLRGMDMEFLAHCPLSRYSKPGMTCFYVLSEQNIKNYINNQQLFSIGGIYNKNIDEKAMEEMINTTGLIISIEQQKYLVSQLAMKTLLKQCGMGGYIAGHLNSVIGNSHIAESYYYNNNILSLVVRQSKEQRGKSEVVTNKIFTVLGGYYKYTPASIVSQAIEAYEGLEVRNYKVSHNETVVYCDFKDMLFEIGNEKVHPGIIIKNSDIGFTSFFVQSYLRVGESCVIIDEKNMKHTSELTMEEIHKLIDKLKEGLPDIIENCKRLEKEVLTKEGNFEGVKAVMTYIIEKGDTSLPVKKTNMLLSCLEDEIDSSKSYSFADIALNIIAIPAKVELHDVQAEALRKNLGLVITKLNDDKLKTRLIALAS